METMTALINLYQEFIDTIHDRISDLIELHGVEPEGFSEKMLDIRKICEKYNIELLVDGYPVCFITDKLTVIDDRGHFYNLHILITSSLDSLCLALDRLSEK